MFSDVLASLRRVKGLDTIAVVTDDARAESAARGGRVLVLRDRAETGQSDATRIGIRHALESAFDRVLLVPGDTPLLDPLEVDGMLTRATAEHLDGVIVPDRAGTGTNALLLRPPDAFDPELRPRQPRASHRSGFARGDQVPRRARAVADARRGHARRPRRPRRPARRAPRRRPAHARRAPPARPLEGVRGDRPPATGHPERRDHLISLRAVPGLPEVRPGDDLAALLPPVAADDIVVVSHKVVSKAEGRVVDLSTVTASGGRARAGQGGPASRAGDPRRVRRRSSPRARAS